MLDALIKVWIFSFRSQVVRVNFVDGTFIYGQQMNINFLKLPLIGLVCCEFEMIWKNNVVLVFFLFAIATPSRGAFCVCYTCEQLILILFIVAFEIVRSTGATN